MFQFSSALGGASQKYPPFTGLSTIRQNLSGDLPTSLVTRLKLVFGILMVDFLDKPSLITYGTSLIKK